MSKNMGFNGGRVKPTTQKAASRIYRAASVAIGGNVPKDSHATRVQRAVHRNASGK